MNPLGKSIRGEAGRIGGEAAKLEQLYQEMNRSAAPPNLSVGSGSSVGSSNAAIPAEPDTQFSADVQQLETMMELIRAEGSAEDPELKQLEGMLDKLLDIQYPDRVRECHQEKSVNTKGTTFQVAPLHDEPVSMMNHLERNIETAWRDSIELIDSIESFEEMRVQRNAFYALDDELFMETTGGKTLEAVIHDTQQLVAGATVRLRLTEAVTINQRTIPKDQMIYGTCSITGERLFIEITSIRNHTTILPISLSVFDLDGLEGIYMPGAISRDAAKQATGDVAQGIQLLSMDNSIGAQAASAGIEATKGLLSKKAKLVKVTVKAGYRVLLQDTNQLNRNE